MFTELTKLELICLRSLKEENEEIMVLKYFSHVAEE